jgi:nicotinate dehydrogenase subunit A
METEFRLTVNGAERGVTCEPDTPLLDVLRHDLGLTGPKFGCGMGLCGACFVLIEGRARASCDLPVSAVGGPVTTVEGLPDGGRLHPVQQAFVDEQAAQRGYCTAGMVMAAAGVAAGVSPLPADLAANPVLARWLDFSRDGEVMIRTGKVEGPAPEG